MTKLAVIADDLTGANDTAVQFAKHGIGCYVSLDFVHNQVWRKDAQVIVIDTDSRDIKAEKAFERVRQVCEILKEAGIVDVYKKVDSTLRGNLGAEIEAAASVLEPEVVVIAPAFPGSRRVTVGGYHLLNGIPVELTEIAHSPKSPVNESRICELLKRQTDAKIGLIALSEVRQGAAVIKVAMEKCLAEGSKWIVFDAVQDAHLRSIAEAAKSHGRVLWVGSAGLANQLSALYPWTVLDRKEDVGAIGPTLLVAGSVSPITQAQIDETLQLEDARLVKLDVSALLEAPQREITRCAGRIQALLRGGCHVVLASAAQQADVKCSMEAGRARGLCGAQVSERTAAAMGEVLWALSPFAPAGLVLTGGDTAIHVCRALEAQAIEIIAEVAVGIPLGRLVGGPYDGLRVVTKAGAFGERDAFVKAIRAIEKSAERTREGEFA